MNKEKQLIAVAISTTTNISMQIRPIKNIERKRSLRILHLKTKLIL
jgi:hypothetical protein